MERIFTSWDKSSEGLPLRLESWICGISVFLRGTLFERASFCFRVYDLNTDGFITKDEMFALMKNCLIKQPQDEDPDESVKDLMEIALRKFDIDKDGKVSERKDIPIQIYINPIVVCLLFFHFKISFQDYLTTVSADPLLLEAFGQCLPSETATISFLTAFQS